MRIDLRERTEKTVAIYFEKAQDAEIKRVLPQKAQTLEEALADYRQTLKEDATSYGRTIWADEKYVGDIWCYCINLDEEPNAMLSYCIFEKEYWQQGVATEALKLFLEEIVEKFQLETIGAFTYASNLASIRVLEKNGFQMMEEFEEDGVLSQYFQCKCR
ncbi:MAG: GNAT family N-acetyltransferase [Roseburia sp.]|nr:GNAT family N-acetyltransferase [Roseburia sp.]